MYLVSYDIASNKIRKKVADKLLGYGRRIQYSVFECDITKAKAQKLESELRKIIKEKYETHIRMYYLDAKSVESRIIMGDAEYITDADGDGVIFI